MFDLTPPRPLLFLLGTLPDDLTVPDGQPPLALEHALGHELIRNKKGAGGLLIVSDPGVNEDQTGLIPQVRQIAPFLEVVAVVGPSSASPRLDSDDFDDVYVWPEDAKRLDAAMNGAKRAERPFTPLATGLLNTGPAACFVMALGVAILLWQMLTWASSIPAYLLPSPLAVVEAFSNHFSSFLYHASITTVEALGGFLIGNTVGFLIAITLFKIPWLKHASLPLILAIQAIPIIALAPLLSIWLGTGITAKVIMAALICTFPIVANLLSAFENVDRGLSDVFRFYRAGYLATLKGLYLPASLPAIVSALRISGGLAVVGAIVAEFTGAERGLGYLLLNATYRFEIEILFVAIIVSGIIGILFGHLYRLMFILYPRSRLVMSLGGCGKGPVL